MPLVDARPSDTGDPAFISPALNQVGWWLTAELQPIFPPYWKAMPRVGLVRRDREVRHPFAAVPEVLVLIPCYCPVIPAGVLPALKPGLAECMAFIWPSQVPDRLGMLRAREGLVSVQRQVGCPLARRELQAVLVPITLPTPTRCQLRVVCGSHQGLVVDGSGSWQRLKPRRTLSPSSFNLACRMPACNTSCHAIRHLGR
jgi:hypothetical protein